MDNELSTRIGTDAHILWNGDANLGDGYDAQTMQSTKSPFTKLNDSLLPQEPSNLEFEFQHHLIKDSEEFKKALKGSVDVSSSVKVASTSSSVQLLKGVVCDPRHASTFIRCTVITPKRVYTPDPPLSEPARELLLSKGPDNFVQRYGSHFIAGQICRSTFTVLLTHHSEIPEEMEHLIQALHTKNALVADQKSLEDLQDTLKTSTCKTHLEIAIRGYKCNDIQMKKIQTLDDIIPLFEAWKSFLQPKPYIAILKHYSLVIDGISRPVSKWKIHTETVEAYKKFLLLQMKTRSVSGISSFQPLVDGVNSLESRLMKIDVFDINWEVKLEEWENDYKSMDVGFSSLYRPIRKRREHLRMVHNTQKLHSWPLGKKQYPGKTTTFSTGITSPDHFEEFASEVGVFKWWFNKDRPPTSSIVQKEACQFGNDGDRIIVGIEAVSEREDHHNNGWFTLRKGGVGQEYVDMLFETSHWRAGEWWVQIWHVEKKVWCA